MFLSRRVALTLRGMLFSRNDANVYSRPRLPTTSLGNSIKSKARVLQEGAQEPTTAPEQKSKAKAKAKAAAKAKAVTSTPEPSAAATDALGAPTPDKLGPPEKKRRCEGKQPEEAPKTAALACLPQPNGASASSQPPTEKSSEALDEQEDNRDSSAQAACKRAKWHRELPSMPDVITKSWKRISELPGHR